MRKIGRNEPCPCGSGKKFKRCHGAPDSHSQPNSHMPTPLVPSEIIRVQRERQQGLGRPIISANFQEHRVVAIRNRVLFSKNWNTFHDFLVDYLKIALGEDWGNKELKKRFAERHPVLRWFHYITDSQNQIIKTPGSVYSAPMIGAVAAYLHLAYDLYALDHNVELQDKLIGRLRDGDNFFGARYEVFVAAALIRAGFEVDFEDEDDRSTTHCEFSAKYPRTGRVFSVEAKYRTGERFRIGRQLIRALQKKANHERIVFVDINIADDGSEMPMPERMNSAVNAVRAQEGKRVNGSPLPPAYVFLTNNSWHHHAKSTKFRSLALLEGFQIPDCKRDAAFSDLRAAINARERHIEMHELIRSIGEHSEIPSTFDGEIPEFAYEEQPGRLLIGHWYLVPDEEGIERAGQLASATVVESEKVAYCVMSLDNGVTQINRISLTAAEMAAWRRYPDTFFGQLGQRNFKAETPLQLYDFFYDTYRHSSREKLLEFMAEAGDIEQLRELDQPTLASIYAERCVYSTMRKDQQP